MEGMKHLPGNTIPLTTAGPRLRCFLGFVFPAIVFIVSAPLPAQSEPLALRDCPVAHEVAVSQVRGEVYDAFGIPVPFATVFILGIHGEVQTYSDETGHFEFDVLPAGHYVLKAEAEGFAFSIAELKVGQTWRTFFTRPKLKVTLGFNGTYCPWVTTSKTKFQSDTKANLKRLKEAAQTDATQK
jgi:Carboxypeptidase regulatory-like domain